MNINEYQKLAERTINNQLTFKEKEYHALHGMVGEIGELHSRKNHKLDEWVEFCEWIETLPYSELITGIDA